MNIALRSEDWQFHMNEHNLSATTMNYCKAKLSCEINAAGATFSGMGTALRVAA